MKILSKSGVPVVTDADDSFPYDPLTGWVATPATNIQILV